MIYRTYDAEEVEKSVEPYATDYDPEWIEDMHNIALSDGNGNINLFTFERPSIYSGHYFYLNRRGQDAFDMAKESLNRIFTFYKAKLVVGLVPVEQRGARLLSEALGFTTHGVVDGYDQKMELFIQTKKDYDTWVA